MCVQKALAVALCAGAVVSSTAFGQSEIPTLPIGSRVSLGGPFTDRAVVAVYNAIYDECPSSTYAIGNGSSYVLEDCSFEPGPWGYTHTGARDIVQVDHMFQTGGWTGTPIHPDTNTPTFYINHVFEWYEPGSFAAAPMLANTTAIATRTVETELGSGYAWNNTSSVFTTPVSLGTRVNVWVAIKAVDPNTGNRIFDGNTMLLQPTGQTGVNFGVWLGRVGQPCVGSSSEDYGRDQNPSEPVGTPCSFAGGSTWIASSSPGNPNDRRRAFDTSTGIARVLTLGMRGDQSGGGGGDHAAPAIDLFLVSPTSVLIGGTFGIGYVVSDSGGSGLRRVELWRATGDGTSCDSTWTQRAATFLSGSGPTPGTFFEAPSAPGTYWYGLHVVDNAGNLSNERVAGVGPILVSVNACAPGLIRDCNGNCAPSSWVDDGVCDSGFYRHNGVPIVFNCAQFNFDGGDCATPPPPIQNPPNHNQPAAPTPPCPTINPPASGQNKLILVTHGRDTTQSMFDGYWVDLANAIESDADVGPDWQVEAYNWTERSTGSPGSVLNEAIEIGHCLGQQIAGGSYQHVHLIAHSAGSALIAAAAFEIKQYAQQQQVTITVHTTYLDAYGGIGGLRNDYGRYADWADHYFSREVLVDDPLCGWNTDHTGPITALRLMRAFNADVTLLDPNYNVFCLSAHSWPRCYYKFTVDEQITDCSAIPPVNTVIPYGFGLSFEKWHGANGVQGWIDHNNREENYPPGRCVILPSDTNGDGNGLRVSQDPPISMGSTPNFRNSTDAVQVGPIGLSMTTLPPGATATSPAWVNFQIATSAPVNFIAFDMTISDNPGAEGLVTVYVDGAECGRVSQPSVTPGLQHYDMATLDDLAPGQHIVSFRLDPFNALASDVTIQNLATGLGEFVPLCDPIDFNGDGLFPDTLDIADFLNVFAGGVCSGQLPTDPPCNTDIDFNNDTLFPDTADIYVLLSVFAGGPCL